MIRLNVVLVAGLWGTAALTLIAIVAALRRLSLVRETVCVERWQPRPLRFRLERLDLVSLVVIAAAGVLMWIGRRDLSPLPPDNFYHLQAAQAILASHSLPPWDTWSFAPFGRPHLYPPAYHVLLAVAAAATGAGLVFAFQCVQALAWPFVLFTAWYFARWLFDAPRAFFALLLVGWDVAYALLYYKTTPSVLAACFSLLAIILFLSGRTVTPAFVAALAFYTHLGSPSLLLLALLVFAAWQRISAVRITLFAALTILLIAPWYVRVWAFADWFHHPIDSNVYGAYTPWSRPVVKLLWLQLINLGLCAALWRGLRGVPWRDARYRLLLVLALVPLPALFSYGSRYFGMVLPIWAVLAARAFTPLLPAGASWRRIGACLALALCPTASLLGVGTRMPPGPVPMVSGWVLPIATGTGFLRVLNRANAIDEVPFNATRDAADFIRAHGPKRGTIYCFQDRYLAIMIGFQLDRPTDSGAWEETRPPAASIELLDRYARMDPMGVYVGRRRGALPNGVDIHPVDDLYIGLWSRTPPKGEEVRSNRIPVEIRRMRHN